MFYSLIIDDFCFLGYDTMWFGVWIQPVWHHVRGYLLSRIMPDWPPLWSSGQSRVRFPALPDFLSSSGSGTGSTQPREVNWGATWIKSSGSGPENRDLRPWGSVALTTWHPSIRKKMALTSRTGGGRSVGIVRSRTKATEFLFVCVAGTRPWCFGPYVNHHKWNHWSSASCKISSWYIILDLNKNLCQVYVNRQRIR